MKTYYAYTRVSTVKQGEKGSSLQEQKDAIRAYAAAHSLTIAEWFEEKETAAKQGRRLFTRMLTSLEKGNASGVILHKVDRGARNLWDWARLQGLLDLGLEVHFVHESLDLNSRGGRLSANLQAVIAADYIWNLRDEVRKGVTGRLKQGLYPLPAPAGYLDRGKAQPKVIDPIKGPLVREAFKLYATGRYNFKTLRAELYERGLKSRSGKCLSKCGLTTILRNPFYIGLIHIKSRKELFSGVHEPLIPKTLYDRVQAILDGRANVVVFKHGLQFRRMLTCAHCGYSLIGEVQKGRAYYRCHTSACATRCVREDAVEEQLHAVLKQFHLEGSEVRELRDEVAKFKASWGETQEQHMHSVCLSLAAIDDRLKRLTDAYIDQLIERDSYTERRAALLHDRVAATDRIKALSDGTASPADDCAKFLEQASSLWLSYENGFPHEKRDLVLLATSNLAVDGKNLAVELRMPFQIFLDQRKTLYGAPHRDGVRTHVKGLTKRLLRHFDEEAEKRKKEQTLAALPRAA